jgi:hypothetical protein
VVGSLGINSWQTSIAVGSTFRSEIRKRFADDRCRSDGSAWVIDLHYPRLEHSSIVAGGSHEAKGRLRLWMINLSVLWLMEEV